MHRRRKLRDRSRLDKARRVAALLIVLHARAVSAVDLNDPCSAVRTPGGLSCPQLARISRAFIDEVGRSVGRSLPVIAASPGFLYRYDPETDAFTRETSIPGQLYLETPSPVGKGRWNLSLGYQHVAFDSFDGKSLDALRDTRPAIRLRVRGPSGAFFVPLTIPALDLDLEAHEVTLSATYGLTSDVDVNLTVPIVQVESDARFRFALQVGGRPQCPVGSCAGADQRSDAGVGDVYLRAKVRLLERSWVEAASGLVIRLPTAASSDFLGVGTTGVAPLIYAGASPFRVAPTVVLRPYVNAGLDLDAEDVEQSDGRWGVGLDVGIANAATLGLGVLARHAFASTGGFAVPRCRGATDINCAAGPPAPLFGLENARRDFYDGSAGLRVDLWRDVLIAFANVLVPLNDAGLRADVVPLVGVEAAF